MVSSVSRWRACSVSKASLRRCEKARDDSPCLCLMAWKTPRGDAMRCSSSFHTPANRSHKPLGVTGVPTQQAIQFLPHLFPPNATKGAVHHASLVGFRHNKQRRPNTMKKKKHREYNFYFIRFLLRSDSKRVYREMLCSQSALFMLENISFGNPCQRWHISRTGLPNALLGRA